MITVVGMGAGAPAGSEVAAGAELVAGGRRHLDAVRLPRGAERVVPGPLAPTLRSSRLAPLPGDGTRPAAAHAVFLPRGVRLPAHREGVTQ